MRDRIKFYDQPKFKEMRAEWQQILKDTGFKDLESPSDEYAPLPNDLATDTRSHRFKTREEEEKYFDIARAYAQKDEFKNATDKAIWELHAEGNSYNEISKKVGLSKSAVAFQVWKIQKKLNLRRSYRKGHKNGKS